MSEPIVIAGYLSQLDRHLRLSRRRRRRIIDEAREHLMDAARRELSAGVDPIEAQARAVAHFGSAAEVASTFPEQGAIRLALLCSMAIVVAITLFVGAGYTLVQQGLRIEANNPQIDAARVAAGRLDGGMPPAQVAGGAVVDIRRDRGLHVSVFDGAGHVVASTASLDGARPLPPAGVLSHARHHGRDSVTWQPADGVRVAAIVRPWGAQGGTVLVGRSLAPAEHLEAVALRFALAAWATLVVLGVTGALLISKRYWRSPPSIAPEVVGAGA